MACAGLNLITTVLCGHYAKKSLHFQSWIKNTSHAHNTESEKICTRRSTTKNEAFHFLLIQTFVFLIQGLWFSRCQLFTFQERSLWYVWRICPEVNLLDLDKYLEVASYFNGINKNRGGFYWYTDYTPQNTIELDVAHSLNLLLYCNI